MHRSIRAGITIGSIWTVLVLLAAAQAAATIQLSIRPQVSCARPGDEFDAELWIDEAGSTFDGYEVTVRFDAARLDTVRLEQGPLMLEACANYPWFYFTATDSSVFISHVILCGGLGLNGPGHLSTIRFRAKSALGGSPLTLEDADFYLAGVIVPDVVTHDAWVTVGPLCAGACCGSDGTCLILPEAVCLAADRIFKGVDVPCDPDPCSTSGARDEPSGSPFRMIAVPNPFQSDVRFTLPESADPTSFERLQVFDAAGRLLRELPLTAETASSAVWDGRDERGQEVPTGTYFARVTGGGIPRTSPVLKIR